MLDVYSRLGFSSEEAEQLHDVYLQAPAAAWTDEEIFAQTIKRFTEYWPLAIVLEAARETGGVTLTIE